MTAARADAILSVLMLLFAAGAVIAVRRGHRRLRAANPAPQWTARTYRIGAGVGLLYALFTLAAFRLYWPWVFTNWPQFLLTIFGWVLPFGAFGYVLVLLVSAGHWGGIHARDLSATGVEAPSHALPGMRRRELLAASTFVLTGAALTFATPSVLARMLQARRWFTVHFVALGEFPAEEIAALAEYVRWRYDITIDTLRPVALDPALVDPRRGQVAVEDLVAAMKRAYAKLVDDPWVILLGLTVQDIYARESRFQFLFGSRQEGRYAVTSTARLDPVFFGQPPDAALRALRLRKMITRHLGVLYYRRSLSLDPRSVLYVNLLGIEDLDAVGEDF